MKREVALAVLAVMFFGVAIILLNYRIMGYDIFTGAGLITLGIHRKTFYRRGQLSKVIPTVLLILGIYYVIIGVFNVVI